MDYKAALRADIQAWIKCPWCGKEFQQMSRAVRNGDMVRCKECDELVRVKLVREGMRSRRWEVGR